MASEPSTGSGAKAVLIFVHIPKTGGKTLDLVIDRQYPRGKAYRLSYQAQEEYGPFFAMTPEQRGRLQCITGHVPYGFHQHLPGKSFVYVSLLREPVARFISEYRYLLRDKRPLAWRPPDAVMEDLEKFLDYRIENHSTNVQTRIISGYFPKPGELPPYAPLPSDALDVAKRNMREHFAVVGTMERYDETLLLIKKRAGWTRSVHYVRMNASSERSAPEKLPPRLVERIREHNRLDAELYECAAALLEQAVAAEGPAFQEELQALRRRNRTMDLILNGWKSTPLWKLRNLPGIRQGRRVIGSLLVGKL